MAGAISLFVRLTTACGISGVGEIYSVSFTPEVVYRMAEDMFQRYLEGAPPDRIEHFWRQAHGSGFTHRPDSTVQGGVSGLEMALGYLSARRSTGRSMPFLAAW